METAFYKILPSMTKAPTPSILASDLLNAVVGVFDRHAPAGLPADSRVFFPPGVGSIEIDVRSGGTNLSLRLLSDHRKSSGSNLSTVSPVPAESCREQGRFHAVAFALAATGDLAVGDMVPNTSEVDACGAISKKIARADPEFAALVSNTNPAIVFKDEEGTGADRMMSAPLQKKLDVLAASVSTEWSAVKLRVTEAWDEDNEHAGNSLHYEGRAADLTTQPIDGTKLGRLARLAVESGFDWVWYENEQHVHVSVKKQA